MSDSKLEAFVVETLGEEVKKVVTGYEELYVLYDGFDLIFHQSGDIEIHGDMTHNTSYLKNLIKVSVYYKNGMHLS